MTKPFNLLEEFLDEHEENGAADDSQEYWNARAEFVSTILKASGSSQQEFSSAIGFSPTYAQKILTLGFAWGTKEKAISTALGLPKGCLSTETATKGFLDLCPIYVLSIDALVNFNSAAIKEAKVMPSAHILQKIAASDLNADVRDTLLQYFTSPETTAEPEDPVTLGKLEKLLSLPVNAIANPDELMRTKSRATQLGIKTRKIIAQNVRAEMQREHLSVVELATRAGISESAVDKLLGIRHQCNMTTLFGIASALSVDPDYLMTPAVEKIVPVTTEQSYQKKEYEDLPLVARAFLSEYLQLIRETRTRGEVSEPTGRAASILILTPLLHYAMKLIENNTNHYGDSPMSLVEIMSNLERNLRVMTAPITAP